MSNKIKTIFIGTPDFAIPSLQTLINSADFEVIGVITQPDKPIGRKQIMTSPAIKTEAEKHSIPVYQPIKIKNEKLKIKNYDLIVVVAYSQIIPKTMLDAPKYGVINVHGSLLPKYRGAACVQWPLINGDKETGTTIMKMDAGLDTGPIIAQKSFEILKTDTAGTLYNKVAEAGARILVPTLNDYISGKIKPQIQNETQANYVKQIKKEDARIDWSKSAKYIERFIRGMQPWPGAFGQLKIKNEELRIKIIWTSFEVLDINKYKLGEIFSFENKLAVQCKKGALLIEKLQMAGKKCISGEQCLCGHKDLIGKILN
ncbi:MAG: methionyl-tRNA formyltransferase [Patescibacteria group bacterium]|nr:methionyl-tRNA formyltransferase [Patescibacteria group bacterium]